MKKDLKQLEEKVEVYYKNHPELEQLNTHCINCGKFLVYDKGDIHFGKTKLSATGITFLSNSKYDGNIYHLCRCQECVGKKFPDIYTHPLLSCKFSKAKQYAFNVPDGSFKKYVHERQSLTKDSMIKKYGEEKGLEKWNSYCQKQSITNTFEYKKEKYGMTEKEFKEYNKSRSSTKELFIKRHGEEVGTKMWEEYCERQRYTTSLEYFIKKYGENDGYEKYANFAKIRAAQYTCCKCTKSKEAELILTPVKNYFQNNEIYFNENEYNLSIKNNNYFLDYYDKTLNIVIEFYGDYWHFNPKYYDETTNIEIYNKHIYDKKRIEFIQKQLNCKVIIVWENEYFKYKDKTIDRIIDIINDKNIKYIELNGD